MIDPSISEDDGYKRILIVAPSWIGDLIMSHSLVRAWLAQYPQDRIDVLAPSWCGELALRMPGINRVLHSPFAHGDFQWRKRLSFGRSLRGQYDLALVLPNSWKSALVPFAANIPIRRGFRGEWRYGLLNDCRVLRGDRYPKMLERFVALAYDDENFLPSEYLHPILHVDLNQQEKLIQKWALHRDSAILALCPGAEYGPAKRWPSAYFATVANDHLKRGGQVWLFGSLKERELAEDIQARTEQRCHDFIGRTQLTEAIDLLALADVVVANDSGLMHIAAALNRPMLALYGSSDPSFTPPLSDRARILERELDCRPCFARTCALKHLKCLNDILPTQVIEQILQLQASR